jgi:hypothetical protein
MDKATEALIDALKQALAEPGEQPLFRVGKSPGLFAGRSGVNGEVAGRAVREGLLEVVRTETRGKNVVELVRPTPKAVDFVHESESPVQALHELRGVLQASQSGIPLWLHEMRETLDVLASRILEESKRWSHRIDALSQRVEEAIRRFELGRDKGTAADGVTWSAEVLSYLDRRRDTGAPNMCPLPELFSAVRERQPDLSVKAFHDELRRLQQRRALNLLPFPGPPNQLPQPEFALLDNAAVLYYAVR